MDERKPCSADKLNLLRHLADREHHLLNDRTNIFLIWHSILMAGFALGKDFPQIILSFFGFVSSLIWLYISHRSVLVGEYFWHEVDKCEKYLPKDEQIYTESKKWRECTRPPIIGIPVSKHFAYILPLLWTVTWLVFILWKTLGFSLVFFIKRIMIVE